MNKPYLLFKTKHSPFWYAQVRLPDGTISRNKSTGKENKTETERVVMGWVVHTRNPNALLLAPLIDNGEITADLAAHIKPDGKYRDHGLLFKILPQNISDLLSDEKTYDLSE